MNSNELERTEELVIRAQQGDSQVVGELFTLYHARTVSYLYRKTNNWHDAEEIAGETFLAAIEKIQQLRNPSSFAGWVRSIAHNLFINRIVQGAKRIPCYLTAEIEDRFTDTEVVNPYELMVKHERQQMIGAAMAKLNDLDIRTLVAYYYRGMSILEMANEERAPLGTIKRRLHVARKRLVQRNSCLELYCTN